MKVLGIDPSSTTIGLCTAGYPTPEYETVRLTGRDIDARIAEAYVQIVNLLEIYRPDVIGIERPAGQNVGSVIAQSMVAGAIRLACTQRGYLIYTVSAAEGKKRLTGNGRATKEQMCEAAVAALHPGVYSYEIVRKAGDVRVKCHTGLWLIDEHQADAYGVALVTADSCVPEKVVD